MNNLSMYDQFGDDYDRFVNWEQRLSNEIPFLDCHFSELKNSPDQPCSILDAACGTGHHLIALAKKGYECTGVDSSQEMIRVAQQNADKARQEIGFHQAEFGKLENFFGGLKFDGLICLGNSLPHLLKSEMLLKTLEDFKSVMKLNGKLIIQNRNFDKVMAGRSRWMPPQTYREGDKTWIFNRFYDFDDDGLVTFNVQKLFSSAETEFSHQVISTRLWPMSRNVLVTHLHKSGFKNMQLYGDLEGNSYEPEHSENLVIECRA